MSTAMSRRLQPLEAPYAPDVAALLERYPKQGGYLLTLFRTFANSKRFLERGVANLLDKESPLPLRQREIVILRVTANLDCEYEWGVHVAAFGRAARFSDAQIAATRLAEADAPCWTAEEALLLRVVDELCAKGARLRVKLGSRPATRNPRALRQLPHSLLRREHRAPAAGDLCGAVSGKDVKRSDGESPNLRNMARKTAGLWPAPEDLAHDSARHRRPDAGHRPAVLLAASCARPFARTASAPL
jgi:Carboxymuconolactone decarboxylase family